MHDLFWTALICGGVLAALVGLDALVGLVGLVENTSRLTSIWRDRG